VEKHGERGIYKDDGRFEGPHTPLSLPSAIAATIKKKKEKKTIPSGLHTFACIHIQGSTTEHFETILIIMRKSDQYQYPDAHPKMEIEKKGNERKKWGIPTFASMIPSTTDSIARLLLHRGLASSPLSH
jgi:hypothetical protein